MGYDIFESVSQGKYGENAPQTSRMEEVADFLYRSCAKNEAKSSFGSAYGGDLYSEQSYIEKYAEEHNCWFSIDDVFELGTPGPSGSENDTYVDRKGGIILAIWGIYMKTAIKQMSCLMAVISIEDGFIPESGWHVPLP